MAGDAHTTARLDELVRDDGSGINARTPREAGGTVIVEHEEETTSMRSSTS